MIHIRLGANLSVDDRFDQFIKRLEIINDLWKQIYDSLQTKVTKPLSIQF
jgi:hypothetical protein